MADAILEVLTNLTTIVRTMDKRDKATADKVMHLGSDLIHTVAPQLTEEEDTELKIKTMQIAMSELGLL